MADIVLGTASKVGDRTVAILISGGAGDTATWAQIATKLDAAGFGNSQLKGFFERNPSDIGATVADIASFGLTARVSPANSTANHVYVSATKTYALAAAAAANSILFISLPHSINA